MVFLNVRPDALLKKESSDVLEIDQTLKKNGDGLVSKKRETTESPLANALYATKIFNIAVMEKSAYATPGKRQAQSCCSFSAGHHLHTTLQQ